MEYSFNKQYAEEYGVNEAIMIRNFQYWIVKNKANKKHLHNERTWTYNSQEAFENIFPFWSRQNIRTILKSLIKQHILITGNFNEKAYDKTIWYAFQNEAKYLESFIGENQPKDWLESTKGLVRINQPIPDIKPNIKPDTSNSAPKFVFQKDKFTHSLDARFEKFYTSYPKKRNRLEAIKQWDELAPSPRLYETIMGDIESRKHSEDWTKENGRFVPSPDKYLIDHIWESSLEEYVEIPMPYSHPDYDQWSGKPQFIRVPKRELAASKDLSPKEANRFLKKFEQWKKEAKEEKAI